MSLTNAGRAQFLIHTLQTPGLTMYAGLCAAVPSDSLTLSDITEPTIATNGYTRIDVSSQAANWPTGGEVNGEPFLDTIDLVWQATGGNFDEAITRVFLTPEQTATAGDVYAVSAALATPLVITPATLVADRTFRFRNILR